MLPALPLVRRQCTTIGTGIRTLAETEHHRARRWQRPDGQRPPHPALLGQLGPHGRERGQPQGEAKHIRDPSRLGQLSTARKLKGKCIAQRLPSACYKPNGDDVTVLDSDYRRYKLDKSLNNTRVQYYIQFIYNYILHTVVSEFANIVPR